MSQNKKTIDNLVSNVFVCKESPKNPTPGQIFFSTLYNTIFVWNGKKWTSSVEKYKVYSTGVTLKEHQEEIQQAKTNLEAKNCKIQEVRMRESSIVNLKYADNNLGDFLSVIYYLTII